MAVMLITHAMGVVAEVAQKVVVMYAGKVVEEAPVENSSPDPAPPLHAGPDPLHPAHRPRGGHAQGAAGGHPRHRAQAHRAGRGLPLCRALQARHAACLHGATPPLREVAPATRWPASWTEARPMSAHPLLQVKNLVKQFPIRGGLLQRVVDTGARGRRRQLRPRARRDAGRGRRIGLRQEHHRRCILRLIEPTSGEVMVRRPERHRAGKDELRALARDMQIIFQDPYASLNPRMTVGAIIGEALTIHKLAPRRARPTRRIVEPAGDGGPEADHMRRYPHEFSGGQRQRIGIARALA
jgi:ABC-type microcin C transport system duplicated ATPase subunit YejF